MNKILFLDRDGVLNHDPGDYTYTLKDFVLLPHTIEALRLAQQKGFKLIVITNQGGISKGLYTEQTVRDIHGHFIQVCKESGVEITAIYFSPHHPDFGNSLTRKPERLMMERAIARYHADVHTSAMIGDRDRDVQCAEAAGVRGILVPTNGNLIPVIEQLE